MSFSLSQVDGSFSKETSEPIWEGFLLKQGGNRGGFRNWKRRWFRLDIENLCYYKQKPSSAADSKVADDNAEVVLGLLPIRNAAITDILSPDDQVIKALEVPPLWDIGATACHDCKKEFSAILRRRFCRSCGFAYCMLCSPRAIILNKLGYADPVRVCTFCFNGATSAGTFRISTIDHLDDNIVTQVREQRRGFELRTKKNAFTLKSPESQLSFQAETATSKLEFLTAIRSIVTYHRHGDNKLESANGRSPSQSKSKHLDRHASASTQWNIDYKAIKILHEVQDEASGKTFKGRLWGTDIAVKTISDVSMVDDLQKEVRLLITLGECSEWKVAIVSELRHPNVVLYIGACLDPPNIAVVTEWCERGSLFDLLYDESPGCVNLDFQTIMSLAIGVAQGMNYLHNLPNKIIHRDLKSQHILIDSHFTPKVADFGLSKVKRNSIDDRGDVKIVTGSLAVGHHKPIRPANNESKTKIYHPANSRSDLHVSIEWMAPEVMEGAPYNQSVDVYSFGIVLSELLSRQLPFRDRYNISGQADVLEAVLEYGAIPTIPDWCGTKMQKIVSDCLNRNPESRPSFTDLIPRLRSFYPLEPADCFQKFDVPRLVFMLSSRNRTQQFRAARELADMSRDLSENCHACGRIPLAYSLIDDATTMKFVTRLSSLLVSDHETTLLHVMVALRAMIDHSKAPLRSKLVSLIRQDETIQQLASYITSQNKDISKAAAELLSRTMETADSVVNMEIIGQTGPEFLVELLNIAEHEKDDLEKQIKDNDDTLSKKNNLATWISSRLRQNDLQGADQHPPLHSVLAPRTVISNSSNGTETVIKPREVSSFENKGLPPQMQAEMTQGAQCWGWLGLLDATGEQWMDVYGVLRNAAIFIFDSEESRPDAYRFIIRIKVGNVTAKFRAGRKRGRQNCLQIALSTELLPIAKDLPQLKRVFINLGSSQRFAFWVQNINEHLEIPIPLNEMEDGVEVN